MKHRVKKNGRIMANSNNRILVIDDDQDIWKAFSSVLAPEAASADSLINDLDSVVDEMLDRSKSTEEAFQLSFAGQGPEGFALAEAAL